MTKLITTPQFSDYIVFVDESGDHGLKRIEETYSVFALSFCCIQKDDYTKKVVPAFQDFKFKYWGHDSVVLHEHEIRKQKGDFAFLAPDPVLRDKFMEDLSSLITLSPIHIFAAVIDKKELTSRYRNPFNPYEIALRFCLERLLEFLIKHDQKGKTAHVIFECRGEEEDRSLELEFRRICHLNASWGYKSSDFRQVRFEAKFSKKAVNSTGLQLADLTARPIGLSVLRRDQPNRAYNLIKPKIKGKKVFP